MRDATYSPSPLLNILHDPTLLSAGSTDSLRGGSRRPSRSPGRRREHRTPIVAAAALAEEERQANHLKSLLRVSSDRLEYEMRRADEAVARADFAERQEREALRRARVAEAENERIQAASVSLERDMRNYQMQLEASQREARRFQNDIRPIEREMEEVRLSEARAQESIQKYQATLREYERQMKERASQMKAALESWYESGRESGHVEGYDQGHHEGRRVGMKEGRKLGRKEGVIEGREQGRNEERRNAVEAFERFLAEDADEQRVSVSSALFAGDSSLIADWADTAVGEDNVHGRWLVWDAGANGLRISGVARLWWQLHCWQLLLVVMSQSGIDVD